MKVLFWTGGFWPRIGGIETQAIQFVEELQKRGHEILVLAQKDRPSWSDEENYRGITIKRFDFYAINRDPDVNFFIFANNYLKALVDDFKPDIINLNSLIGCNAFLFLLLRKMFAVPAILTMHCTSSVKEISAHVDHICCVSNYVLGKIERACRHKNSPLKVIYNGLSTPDVSPSPISFSPPTILGIGRLTHEKGFDILIKAFSILKKDISNARLIIVGDGEKQKYLKRLVSELEIKDHVQFTGELSREEIFNIINQSTFVVVPSRFETFGLVALESMLMQRPVIASNLGGLPEVISNGETGILVKPKDPIALCAAMQHLLSQPEKLIRMGMCARLQATEKFSLQNNVDQYERLFYSIAKK